MQGLRFFVSFTRLFALLKKIQNPKLKRFSKFAFHFGGLRAFGGKTNIKIKNLVQIFWFHQKRKDAQNQKKSKSLHLIFGGLRAFGGKTNIKIKNLVQIFWFHQKRKDAQNQKSLKACI